LIVASVSSLLWWWLFLFKFAVAVIVDLPVMLPLLGCHHPFQQ